MKGKEGTNPVQLHHVVNHEHFKTILREVKKSLQACDDELFVLAIFCKRGEQRSVAACALVSFFC